MSVAALSMTDAASPSAPPPQSVLLVGPLPPPSGGMANQTRQLARLLEAEGCTVTLVQTNAPYRPAWIGAVRGVRAICRLVPYVFALWRASRDARVVHIMANSGWSWHLFAAPAIHIAAWRCVPVVVNYRGGEAARFLARQHALVRISMRKARAVVVPSGFLRDVFARHGIATTIVPNIVDLDAFKPASVRADAPHVVVTRNLEPIYDIATALRAFAIVVRRLPAARMTVAGSGPERAALESLATELGIDDRVTFTGRLDNRDLPALYRTATVAVNPSLVDNMPISLLEAMASGVPIVSTNVGGVPHMIENRRTGLLVSPGDPPAMAAALLEVIESPALAAALAAAGLETAPRYSWPRVRGNLFGVYAAAVDERNAGGAERQ